MHGQLYNIGSVARTSYFVWGGPFGGGGSGAFRGIGGPSLCTLARPCAVHRGGGVDPEP